ncbi:LOW QUALITY PROTEIN: dual 3',5'-cyclic-AMP and -GMP phosphodiesterase 11-like [Centruroides vittatus]|uniref:LOW QUALITY PROTEIN: dual 3',5'-cyclic-AMP and -GMP phosphodiesterase 11-like n=1 Tax=Centruroides vittatus TaxID=120091 RepID=UPI00350F0491
MPHTSKKIDKLDSRKDVAPTTLWRLLWPPGWHPRGGPSVFDSGATSGTSMDEPPGEEDLEGVESWLDEHPSFVYDYFVRKATRHMVDSWLLGHATQGVAHEAVSTPASPTSKSGSGATTPVRKISAHDFERGGLLRPIVSTTVDGTPTFLPLPLPGEVTSFPASRPNRKSRQELQALDEREMIFELVKDICNDLDVRSLCHKILQNVSILTRADRCSLFLVGGEKGSPNRYLVSQLFDVSSDSTLQQMNEKEEIRLPWGKGIVGYVAEKGESVNITDCYQDSRFNHTIDRKTGYTTRSMLCMPIFDNDGQVLGVAQVINKNGIRGEAFDTNDEKVFAQYLQFCGIGLRNAQLYERSELENKRNQVLLDLARMIFEEQSTIEHIVYRIMTHTQSLLGCERCQVLLVDESTQGTFSRVFDLDSGDMETEDSSSRISPIEGRFPINVGITGYVAATGEALNIPDAYADDRFDQSVDRGTSFRHRNVLCMPIRNADGKILGVSQLINKSNGTPFNKNDENLFEAFAIFCGMGIHNTQMYEKAIKAMAKQRVTLEVLSYHATAPLEEAYRLKKALVPSTQAYKLHDLRFNDFSLDDDEMLKACLRMFLDLDLIERFHIDYLVLCRWLLSVRKNYRQVTYHNWRHAFNVGQMMFAILTNTELWRVLGELETLALLVACLCHDLDHRGTNNSFQIKSCSPLAQLYSTSTMEHHHFDQCIMILNSHGNQILSHLSPEEYSWVVHVLEDAILATDLAVYFRRRGTFFKLISTEEYDWQDENHRELLRAMLMTACDVAAITKPWEIQRVVAELVASEFFQQGDMEKEELKIQPIDMMNREKKDQLPLMQVRFIDAICVPIYEAFTKIHRNLSVLSAGVAHNRLQWLKLAEERKVGPERDK